MTINAGFSSSKPHLPIGLMMVAKRFDEAVLLGLAHAYERLRNNDVQYCHMETSLRSAMHGRNVARAS